MVDWNSCHPDIDARLQRIAFRIEAQDRRMLRDSVFEQDHVNVVVKRPLPSEALVSSVSIRRQKSADTFEAPAYSAQESYARRSECDSPCKLEHELFVRSKYFGSDKVYAFTLP